MTTSSWNKIRKDFPVTRKAIYLDHAAGGIIPRPVEDEVNSFYRQCATGGDFFWPKWVAKRESVRAKVADFIGAKPSEIAFITSTSQGMNFIAEFLHDQGSVLTNTSEFPSSTLPWVWRKSKMIWQNPEKGILSLAKLKALMSPSVKTIVTSYVQYCTGFRQDLTALGKLKGGRYLVVNASQALGALAMDVKKWNADFLVSNSYKWLMGGYGGGILYMKEPWVKRFRPRTVGWRSAQTPEKMNNRELEIKDEASRYEMGCPSFPTIFGIGAAVDYLSGIGKDKVEKRILDLTDYAIQCLDKKGIPVLSPREKRFRSGIVIAGVSDAQAVWQKLIRKKIFVSLRGGGIRIAPHIYNTFEDMDALMKVISA